MVKDLFSACAIALTVIAAFSNAGFHKIWLKEQGEWLLKYLYKPFSYVVMLISA
ncbi:MAG: hypothetical protein HON51_08090 [Gammaproteobacteria bacterium]|jgi:hypothetical protein|nr:hypothetical protein [Gammaproteobacteria bacterium]MBT5223386.1 hypothetical protein [Gammaproteobacteria bacterium]MBT5825439.1 hypothetical protein [Gammaproteobacteria bacterium]MBT6576168.1 hypothetical protein [Gammaproteobacteria bacterium]